MHLAHGRDTWWVWSLWWIFRFHKWWRMAWLHHRFIFSFSETVLFRGAVSNCPTRCDYVQFLYFCKLLYMFRVVTPPIIRSTYNCNYSIWYWSNFGKCSVWSQLKMRDMVPTVCATFRDRTIAEGNTDGTVHTLYTCYNYSYMCSWWWVELLLETCGAVYRNVINCI
jgi:hypothetical protein